MGVRFNERVLGKIRVLTANYTFVHNRVYTKVI